MTKYQIFIKHAIFYSLLIFSNIYKMVKGIGFVEYFSLLTVLVIFYGLISTAIDEYILIKKYSIKNKLLVSFGFFYEFAGIIALILNFVCKGEEAFIIKNISWILLIVIPLYELWIAICVKKEK